MPSKFKKRRVVHCEPYQKAPKVRSIHSFLGEMCNDNEEILKFFSLCCLKKEITGCRKIKQLLVFLFCFLPQHPKV